MSNELTEKYPDMWIAVLDKEVVIASKDLGKVKTMARKKAKEVGRGPCVYIFVESFQRLRRSPKYTTTGVAGALPALTL